MSRVPEGMKQFGTINYGDVLNKEVWLKEAKSQGYTVVDYPDQKYAELYLPAKK
jgi:hypothetical protein